LNTGDADAESESQSIHASSQVLDQDDVVPPSASGADQAPAVQGHIETKYAVGVEISYPPGGTSIERLQRLKENFVERKSLTGSVRKV
jgi:hypothetical protein